MDYRMLEAQRQKHPAWRLLRADHAALIASFLHQVFIAPNVRTLPQADITSKLEDTLYRLRRELGDEAFPRDAQTYVDDWATDQHGWLRKYYPPQSDEAHFDITPATEKAIEWLSSLGERPFVGAESRLMTVFELLRGLVEGAESDPERRVARLRQRKAEIEREIARVEVGRIDVMGATGVKERFLQMSATARGLLADFREVEQNFRNLDRTVRERIATWEGGKSDLLSAIFDERDAISDSDQGRSFRAFWDFLMSSARQEEFTSLLAAVLDMEPVKELSPDRRLLRIHYDWLEAGESAQRTVARLSEQLRRYLDDQAWLENRRIMELIRDIEQSALDIRASPPTGMVAELDDAAPSINLVMDRPLFSPALGGAVADDFSDDDMSAIPADALFEQVFVDKARLATNIRRALQQRRQISLQELVAQYPLEQGLAELVAYFALAAEDGDAVIDDTHKQTVTWMDATTGLERQATMPVVIYGRAASAPVR
jgi:hypothetical protein